MPAIAFRCDASSVIGFGHVMRCLVLAGALQQRSLDCRFLCGPLPEELAGVIRKWGVQLDTLPARCESAEAWQSDAAEVLKRCDALPPIDWMVVDHYCLDFRWEERIARATGAQVMVIDDLANRSHCCDLLLDQNLYTDMAHRYSGLLTGASATLLGPRYALIREQFRRQRDSAGEVREPVRRLFVSFGGSDPADLSSSALRAIDALGVSELSVDLVLGAGNPNRHRIARDCLGKTAVRVHVQTDRMAGLMAAADLAVGAGGVSAWERCCIGVPALSVAVADNQVEQLRVMARSGLTYSPNITGDPAAAMGLHLAALMANPDLRSMLSRRSMDAVDGYGAERVAARLLTEAVLVRQATGDDCRRVFEWRNHATVRRFSADPGEIDWEHHQRWFHRQLESASVDMLIGCSGERDIGVLKFDYDGSQATVSIYLAAACQGMGLGPTLLARGESWLRASGRGVATVKASVVAGNARSEKLFTGSGYSHSGFDFSKRID